MELLHRTTGATLDVGSLTTNPDLRADAPAALLSQSPRFRQGEALFAGGFVPAPCVVQVRGRLTHEGGKDVSVPLRRS